MDEIKNYRDLEAWQVGIEMVVKTYNLTNGFPRSELYGITREMRRSAVSVPSNIAEGHARGGRAEVNHLNIGLGSAAELDTQLEAAIRLNFVSKEDARPLLKSLESGRRLMYGLRRARYARLGLSAGSIAQLLVALRFFG